MKWSKQEAERRGGNKHFHKISIVRISATGPMRQDNSVNIRDFTLNSSHLNNIG